MSKFWVGILSGLVGLVLGGLGGATLGTGFGAGTGLMVGACGAVGAAQQLGMLDASQVDQVINRAAANLAASTNRPVEEITGGSAKCDEILAKARSAG